MRYKVKDIKLADLGRRMITLEEHEMPGLMSVRAKYGAKKPLAGARVAGSLHMTVETAILIETLRALGADVRWASCNIFSTNDAAAAAIAKSGVPVFFSTNDAAAAAIAKSGVPVFAWKGETLEEYWWCTKQALTWPDGSGPDLIVDDGGDATLLLHLGVAAESDPSVIAKPESAEQKALFATIAETLKKSPHWFSKAAARVKGVSEETTTGVHRLYQLEKEGKLLFPAVNVNDSVTKSKFDNIYGCRESLVDGIKRALDVMLAGKNAFVCGYGDVGKGCAESLRENHCRVRVSEADPICALQACMAGFQVGTVEDALGWANLFVTCTGNLDVITAEHMAKMRDQAIVCNIGHFDDEIQVARLMSWPGVKRTTIKPQVDMFTYPDGQQLHEPVPRADEALARARRGEAARGASAEGAGRGGRAPAPRRMRREAHEAHEAPGRLHRRGREGPLQARLLPLLKTRTRKSAAMDMFFRSVPVLLIFCSAVVSGAKSATAAHRMAESIDGYNSLQATNISWALSTSIR